MSSQKAAWPGNAPGFFLCLGTFSLAFVGSGLIGRSTTGFNPLTPSILAILLGIVIANVFRPSDRFKPGVNFCLKTILRMGIVLIGLQLSLLEVGELGALGLPVVFVAVLTGLVGIEILGRLLGLPLKLIYLLAAGTSICGVTAIMTTAPVVEAEESDVVYAVANVTLFGLIGTLAYPYLIPHLFAAGKACGLFLGTAIHDTAQVLGAAANYKQLTGDEVGFTTATITKMTRNMLLAVVVPYFAWRVRQNRPAGEVSAVKQPPLLPAFIVGFLGMSLIRTLGDYTLAASGKAFALLGAAQWKTLLVFLGKTLGGTWMIGLALVGVGLSLRADTFRGLGLRPFVLGFSGAAMVGLASFSTITALFHFLGG